MKSESHSCQVHTLNTLVQQFSIALKAAKIINNYLGWLCQMSALHDEHIECLSWVSCNLEATSAKSRSSIKCSHNNMTTYRCAVYKMCVWHPPVCHLPIALTTRHLGIVLCTRQARWQVHSMGEPCSVNSMGLLARVPSIQSVSGSNPWNW
jgi:hypothetical protein